MALYTQHMQIGFPLLGTASYTEIAVPEDNSVCNATFYFLCAICDLAQLLTTQSIVSIPRTSLATTDLAADAHTSSTFTTLGVAHNDIVNSLLRDVAPQWPQFRVLARHGLQLLEKLGCLNGV